MPRTKKSGRKRRHHTGSRKRHSGHTTHRRHRSRVGNVHMDHPVADALMLILGALGGNWLANIGNEKITAAVGSKVSPQLLGWGLGALEGGAGVYAVMKGKHPLLQGAGIGFGLAGANQIEKQLGLVSGMGYINLLPTPRMAGPGTGLPPSAVRQPGRLGAPGPQTFRQPKTVGQKPNMTAVYAAGTY